MVFQMTSSAKQKTLLLFGLVMLVTVMIAASLPQLELQPGMPLPKFEKNQMVVAPVEEQVFVAISVSKFILVFFALILTGSMLYVLYRMFKGADWKFLTSFFPSTFVISLMALSVIFFIMLLPKSNLSFQWICFPDRRRQLPRPLGRYPRFCSGWWGLAFW
jgi:hypothetical protein